MLSVKTKAWAVRIQHQKHAYDEITRSKLHQAIDLPLTLLQCLPAADSMLRVSWAGRVSRQIQQSLSWKWREDLVLDQNPLLQLVVP